MSTYTGNYNRYWGRAYLNYLVQLGHVILGSLIRLTVMIIVLLFLVYISSNFNFSCMSPFKNILESLKIQVIQDKQIKRYQSVGRRGTRRRRG